MCFVNIFGARIEIGAEARLVIKILSKEHLCCNAFTHRKLIGFLKIDKFYLQRL